MSAAVAEAIRPDLESCEEYAARLYERHQRAIFGFCLKQLRRREDADDAVQTTFIYALLSLRRGVVPEFELPWLLTIARNVCSTRRRSGIRRGAHEAPHDLEAIQDRLPAPDRSTITSDDFTAALREIPDRQRRALLLREWRGCSYDEIGSELGLSQPATEALLFRARQNVADRLSTSLKSLNGLPLISLLRRLVESTAMKTAVAGAGAALTVVAVPAAEQDGRSTTVPSTVPVVHVDRPAVGSQVVPSVTAPQRSQPTPIGPRQRTTSETPAPASAADDVGAAAEHVATPSTAASTSTPMPPAPSPPPTSTKTGDLSTTTKPAADAVQGLVDTAGQAAGSLGLPPVSVPPISVPAVSLPVTTPALPVVHLP